VLYEDLLDFLSECGIPVPEELKPEQISVLLVDDDEAYLRSFKKSLHRTDRTLDLHTCTSGYDALIFIGARHPNVVILDIFMPGLDGVEVCQRIKANPDTQDVMVIANTGHPSPALEKKVLEAGAAALLVKPFKSAAVLELIQPKHAKRAGLG
jgi:CheY-like chemotaxis protein